MTPLASVLKQVFLTLLCGGLSHTGVACIIYRYLTICGLPRKLWSHKITSSVGDRWHFGSDPDPTPFFNEFKDAKKLNFFVFFLITCPQAYHFPSKKFNFVLKFHFAGIISVRSTHLKEKIRIRSQIRIRRPKNIRILRIRFRIPNTDYKQILKHEPHAVLRISGVIYP
jgi:hypothetical protein